MIPCREPLRGMLTLMYKKFGILGAHAIAVGIMGAPYFRNIGSPKIWKYGSAPSEYKVLTCLFWLLTLHFYTCQDDVQTIINASRHIPSGT